MAIHQPHCCDSCSDLKNQRLDLLEKELSQTELINGPNVSFYEVSARIINTPFGAKRFSGLLKVRAGGRSSADNNHNNGTLRVRHRLCILLPTIM